MRKKIYKSYKEVLGKLPVSENTPNLAQSEAKLSIVEQKSVNLSILKKNMPNFNRLLLGFNNLDQPRRIEVKKRLRRLLLKIILLS